MPDRDLLRQCAVAAAVAGGILSGATGHYGDANESTSRVLPANYAFSIWFPIYAGVLGYAGYQALPTERRNRLLRRTGGPAAAAVGLSGLWARTSSPAVQLPLIAATTSAALLGYARATPVDQAEQTSAAARWLVRVPLGLFSGWITLAAGAAVPELLIDRGVRAPRPGADFWGTALLASLAGAAVAVTRRLPVSAAYPAAVAWGLAGTAVRTLPRYRAPGIAAALGAGAVAFAGLRAARRNAEAENG
ncbi:hypothetical protein I6N91_04020 [Arthrobacter sp. MSA 4-2]|uniref:hypothetical protein n=1 Tax=Arthrobacter sp. MSA 4-2 TaxID=2794349 RepID=UPI0018E79403|nr:hypothetical protein [Arthrobacter sp. MSA 4-2]MBJ2120143.1 hypothetical protein [Arthrobacter sp. MSA 4-2]